MQNLQSNTIVFIISINILLNIIFINKQDKWELIIKEAKGF